MAARSTKMIYGAALLVFINSAIGIYCAYYPPATPVPTTIQHLLNMLYALVIGYYFYNHTPADDVKTIAASTGTFGQSTSLRSLTPLTSNASLAG